MKPYALDTGHPWSGDLPPEDAPAPPIYYRCLAPGCDWVGRADGAVDHHFSFQPHHRFALRDYPTAGPIHFSCCPREDRAR